MQLFQDRRAKARGAGIRAAAAVLAAMVCTPAIASAPSLVVEFHDRADYRGTLTLTFAGAGPCTVSFTGRGATVEACTVATPPAGGEVRLAGAFTWNDYKKGAQKARGELTWRVADLSPLLAPVRDRTRSFGSRLRAFVAAKARFEQGIPDLNTTEVSFDDDAKATASAIAGAEKRVGFALPAAHVELLSDVGQVLIGDSSTEPAARLTNAWDAMLTVWETPKASLERETTPATQQLLRATALLYTEAGDGYAGLLYKPSAPVGCTGSSAYYWIQQDGINQPRALTRPDGACLDYTEAMVWLLNTQAIMAYEDGDLGLVFVDRSVPGPVRLELVRRSWGKDFDFTLTPKWDATY